MSLMKKLLTISSLASFLLLSGSHGFVSKACSPGFEYNAKTSQCVLCVGNSVSKARGRSCEVCPSGTKANASKTECEKMTPRTFKYGPPPVAKQVVPKTEPKVLERRPLVCEKTLITSHALSRKAQRQNVKKDPFLEELKIAVEKRVDAETIRQRGSKALYDAYLLSGRKLKDSPETRTKFSLPPTEDFQKLLETGRYFLSSQFERERKDSSDFYFEKMAAYYHASNDFDPAFDLELADPIGDRNTVYCRAIGRGNALADA